MTVLGDGPIIGAVSGSSLHEGKKELLKKHKVYRREVVHYLQTAGFTNIKQYWNNEFNRGWDVDFIGRNGKVVINKVDRDDDLDSGSYPE